jgi:hypothetical protein
METGDASAPPSDGGGGSSPDAAPEDGSSGNHACVHAWECYASHPGACAVCTWPLNYAVCIEHQCGCACDGLDASGE